MVTIRKTKIERGQLIRLVFLGLNAKVIKVEIHPISQFFGNFAKFYYVNYDIINLLRHNFI